MSNQRRFEGRVVLVTGASRGIGRAIALAFASEGAPVAMMSTNSERNKAVADEIAAAGGRAVISRGAPAVTRSLWPRACGRPKATSTPPIAAAPASCAITQGELNEEQAGEEQAVADREPRCGDREVSSLKSA